MTRIVILGAVVVVVLFGAYGAITLYDENMKVGRMWETPGVKPHEAPLLPMPAGVVPAVGGEAVFRSTPGNQLTAPVSLSDPMTLSQGKAAYFMYCAQCHGNHYDGNGTVGQSFAPLPTDLRSPVVQGAPAGDLFKSISYGIPGGRQPPLATTVEVNDRWRIIGYIKSLGLR